MAFCSACVLKESLPSERRVSFRPWATLLRYGEVLKVPAFTSGVVAHGFIFLGLIVYSAGAAAFVLNVVGLGDDSDGGCRHDGFLGLFSPAGDVWSESIAFLGGRLFGGIGLIRRGI